MNNNADKSWLISEEGFNLTGASETRFAVSNGYFAVRGTTEELYDSETPGTFVAGVFDKWRAAVTELVNLPYPFGMRIYIDREYVDLRQCNVNEHKRELDMYSGMLTREYLVTDARGRSMRVKTVRLASMEEGRRHLGAAHITVICENFNGVICVEQFIDCNVYNLKNNPNERERHFHAVTYADDIYAAVVCETKDEKYNVSIGVGANVSGVRNGNHIGRHSRCFDNFTAIYDDFEVQEGTIIQIERITTVQRRGELCSPEICEGLELGWDKISTGHCAAMAEIWEKANITIEGDPEADRALRFCIYSLICSANPSDESVSIGAKGLHGEGYKGHVFWDTELFMLPFFTYSLPDYARTLLSYRWHTLEGAKKNAELGGYKGARYPWESADTGLEETPQWGFDYKRNKVRIWTGDIEIHITCDIVYALREYYLATGDEKFLKERATPIILETARFWASRLEYDEKRDVYEIKGVIGPDEFHEHVDNNAYTNSLVKWNMLYAAELSDDTEEAKIWIKMAEKIFIPRSGGLIEQYDGFFKKKDVLVTEFDENHMPLWPEGVDITKLSNYQLVKQADVIMLMHLLDGEFTPEEMQKNYIYYENRTMHKSSLSPSMYALLGVRTGQYGKAYTNFMRTVMTDIADNQGNTAHGIHAAAAGGAWCAMFYGFLGVKVDKNGELTVNPWLPEKWKKITMNFYFRGERMRLTCTKDGFELENLG